MIKSPSPLGNSPGRNTRVATGSHANKGLRLGTGGTSGKENARPWSQNPMHPGTSAQPGKSDLQEQRPEESQKQGPRTVNMHVRGAHTGGERIRTERSDQHVPHQSAMPQHLLGITHAQPDSIESINVIENALERQTFVQNHLNHTATNFNLDSVDQALSSIPIEGASELPQLTDDPVVNGFYDDLTRKKPNDIYNFLIDTLRFADGREVTPVSLVSDEGSTSSTIQPTTGYHIEYSNTYDSQRRILLAHGLFQKDAQQGQGFELLGKVRAFLERSTEPSVKHLVQELDNVVESLRPITVLYKIDCDLDRKQLNLEKLKEQYHQY
ncbi:MAG: hypothetical protein VXX85_03285, partial [Candidatus Margulisiibacteriota bacterium]|nr:hypothetical protein [Candidatus Margulisiibacteriota bacterium]